MITDVQKMKEELKRTSVDAEGYFAQLCERAYNTIECLEESIAELERDLDDWRQDFEALSREFDVYVSENG